MTEKQLKVGQSWNFIGQNHIKFYLTGCHLAAVSCSCVTPGLAGLGFGSGTTGKLGRAWVVVHGCMAFWACLICFGVPEPVTSLVGGCHMKLSTYRIQDLEDWRVSMYTTVWYSDHHFINLPELIWELWVRNRNGSEPTAAPGKVWREELFSSKVFRQIGSLERTTSLHRSKFHPAKNNNYGSINILLTISW